MPSKSLALRILGLNLLMIVLPLLVYIIVFLNHQYTVELEVSNQRFKSLALSRASLLEHEVNNQYTAINLIAGLLHLDDKNVAEKKDVIEEKMKEITKEGDYSGIVFFRRNEQNQFIATFSAKQTNDGRDFSFREYVQLAFKNGRSAYLAEDINNFAKELLVSQSLYGQENYTFLGILTVFYNPDKLIELLVKADTLRGLARLSLLTSDKIVFASSDPNFLYTALAPISTSRLNDIAHAEQFGIDKIPRQTLHLTSYSSNSDVFLWEDGSSTRRATIVPVKGTEFFMLIDIDNNYFFHNYMKNLAKLLLVIGIIVMIASLATLFLCEWLYQPLKTLILTTNQVSSGNLQVRYPKTLFGYEINDAGEIFNTMVFHLTENIKRADEEKIKTETVSKELKLGHEIQASILPKHFVQTAGLQVAGLSLPAHEVGGDFYDIQPLNEHIYFSISSTSGKGILACFYALCLRSMLRSFTSEKAPLDKILEKTNELFYSDVKNSGLLVQTFIASWNQSADIFEYACAGSALGFVVGKDDIQNLTGSTGLMGIAPHSTYTKLSLKLATTDLIVLYTKGVIEAQNAAGYMYGEDALKHIVHKNRHMSATALVELIKSELTSFSQNARQESDMTLLVIKVA